MRRPFTPVVLATCAALIVATLLVAQSPASAAAAVSAPVATPATVASSTCVSNVGPGIAPPAVVPSGIPGFHASWYGQSGYPTLCAGQRSTATVAYYNSGSRGWVLGRMGEMAYLGAWDPVRGSEGESALGGTGSNAPDTGWPAPNRPAAQPAEYVGPNQIAWFRFTIEAPTAPGTYRLYIRPLIEGATWMEDQGVFWEVRVVAPKPTQIVVAPSTSSSGPVGWIREYTAVVPGASCVDLAFIDVADIAADGSLAQAGGTARLSRMATFSSVNGGTAGGAFSSCVAVGATTVVRFSVTSSVANANVRPVVFVDTDGDDALDVASEPFALGGALRFLPAEADAGDVTVTVGAVSLDESYFVDAAGSAMYRFDPEDRFTRWGSAMTFAWFRMLLSRGDVLAVTYASGPYGRSTFTFVRDVGRDAPTMQPLLDSWDGGATQNDVGLLITEPATNVDGIAYAVERADAASGSCDAQYGYRALASIDIAAGSNDGVYVDRDLGAGGYCYRIGVADLLSAQVTYSYARVIVSNPPPVVALPRSVDARLVLSAGSPATLDAGDVIKIAFDKRMRGPVGGTLLLGDPDGTVAELRCGAEARCSLSTGTASLGGVSYAIGQVVTIELIATPRVLVAGSAPGLQAHATILAGDLVDAAGNMWDLAGSEDRIVGAPD